MRMSGSAKAAIFLLSLEEDKAVKIIEQLDHKELKQLRKAVEELNPISADTIEKVYTDFSEAFKKGVTPVRGGGDYLRDLVRKARGDDEALRLFASSTDSPRILPVGQKPLAALANIDPDVLRVAISEEHPQVAAAVLAHIDANIAAVVLENLPLSQQADILRRVATLRSILPTAFADAEYGLGGLEIGETVKGGEIDGLSTAANILNEMIGSHVTDVLERIAEDHPDDAVRLQRAMFSFEHLIEADSRGLQQVLREVQSDTLLIALKTASEPLKQKILSCMSSRASTMLLEELEVMPPVRLSEVEAAQHQIIEIAMRLMGEGKLSIKGRGEELL